MTNKLPREVVIVGLDANGELVGAFGVRLRARNAAWTPRQMKKMLARDGAVSFKRTTEPAQGS